MANLTKGSAMEWASPPPLPNWLSGEDHRITQITAALNSKMHRERWKYTRVKPVLDMLPAAATVPKWEALPEGVTLKVYKTDDTQAPVNPSWDEAPEACASLFYQPCVHVLEVSGDVDTPLTINHDARTVPLVIKLNPHARLDLREIFTADAPEQVQTLWIELADGAQLGHSRNNFSQGQHWQYLHVTIGRDATYTLHNHSNGSKLRRQDIQIVCAQPGAHTDVTSAAFVDTGCHLDQQITIEHMAAQSTSQQTFHNIGAAQAKITFNGRIHIHAQCPGVDATLSNKNLSLGEGCIINTKPELEIYTDDVKCAHGATVGQLDENHLFYCTSRGIPIDKAHTLLSQAFLNNCTTGPLAEDARTLLQAQFKASTRG